MAYFNIDIALKTDHDEEWVVDQVEDFVFHKLGLNALHDFVVYEVTP